MTDDGWIPWNGGKCPVIGKRVEIERRDGTKRIFAQASVWDGWNQHGHSTDIMAYRILP